MDIKKVITQVKDKLHDYVSEAEINIVGSKRGDEKFDFVINKATDFVASQSPLPDALEKPAIKWILGWVLEKAIAETVDLMNLAKKKLAE